MLNLKHSAADAVTFLRLLNNSIKAGQSHHVKWNVAIRFKKIIAIQKPMADMTYRKYFFKL